ncbi:MAG: aconitate hydratase B, partial [Gammaproteobacteria bacterium]
MLEAYRTHVAERAAQGLPPLPLDTKQTAAVVDLLKNPPVGEAQFLLDLLTQRVPPGVDQAAYVKACFLTAIAKGELQCPLIDRRHATELLGTMLGGYNIHALLELLDNEELAPLAAQALAHTLLIFDAYHDVVHKAQAQNNPWAKQVLQAWADAAWFTRRPALPDEITVTVFKVPGETNTDDLSPASEAWSRPDIPLHAQAMLINKMPDALQTIEALKAKGYPLAYVGDVVGTGSSRKSAINSILWHLGNNISY